MSLTNRLELPRPAEQYRPEPPGGARAGAPQPARATQRQGHPPELRAGQRACEGDARDATGQGLNEATLESSQLGALAQQAPQNSELERPSRRASFTLNKTSPAASLASPLSWRSRALGFCPDPWHQRLREKTLCKRSAV
ncbi:heat shock protein beta-7 isoform X1 [Bos indicus x Bos taurus]|uniref:heat shock protein beta-7 isoform X1 n=1 Tax=Bos indicus x Bos taurus TaxID=30522 RepID=UPI000F7D5A47|nr:heat shock protein beta-7 isoform X1 [Bos indicus x Bos taurus]